MIFSRSGLQIERFRRALIGAVAFWTAPVLWRFHKVRLSPAVEKAPEDRRITKPAGAKCLPLTYALIALCAVWLLGGCATYDRKGLEPGVARAMERAIVSRAALAPELEQ